MGRIIHTSHGDILTPTFMPVTTFGEKYPLDKLVQPYLKRLSQCLMVSYYYAKQMKERPNIPMFIDSGGFASLFDTSQIIDYGNYASIKVNEDEEIKPLDVLEFQERTADIGATLDFVISPKMDEVEAKRRQELTIKNALWALENKRSKNLLLYASIQCWDEESARVCARAYAKADFDGVCIGGLVPRAKDIDYITTIVKAVREEIPDKPIHVFGIGKIEVLNILWELGVDSADSSSYIRNAVGVTTHKSMINLGKIITGPQAPLFAALDNLHKINSAIA